MKISKRRYQERKVVKFPVKLGKKKKKSLETFEYSLAKINYTT